MERTGIVAFAFGLPAETTTNIIIGHIASQNAEKYKAPIYTERNIPVDWSKISEVHWHPGEPGKPVALLDLATGAAEWAKRRNLKKLLVATAKPALGRSVRDLRYALNERNISVEVKPCAEINSYSNKDWFSAGSTLARSRFSLVWWSREAILRLLPMFLYKWAASYSNPLSKRF